jgi:hypothetical protein
MPEAYDNTHEAQSGFPTLKLRDVQLLAAPFATCLSPSCALQDTPPTVSALLRHSPQIPAKPP